MTGNYAKTGVDIKKEADSVGKIISIISSTFDNRKGKEGEVKSEIGHFANFIDVGGRYLVMSTDGVGTKVLVAQEADKYDTIGIDMIAMNVNDIICVGAEPIALVDYLAIEKLDDKMIEQIAQGIKRGADESGIAVIGGETASLKGVITGIGEKGFDLAGTALGIVDKEKTILGNNIRQGDIIIGMESTGLHSNGYSLARKVILENYETKDILPWNTIVKDELLKPTRLYVKPVLQILKTHNEDNKTITGLCHITGGGLLNLKRLNKEIGFLINDPIEPTPIFKEIQKLGQIDIIEMYETFNMGMGFVMIVRPGTEEKIIEELNAIGTPAKKVGIVTDRKGIVEVPKYNIIM